MESSPHDGLPLLVINLVTFCVILSKMEPHTIGITSAHYVCKVEIHITIEYNVFT